MKVVRILGIDPGFDRLGICILDKEGNNEKIIHSECVTTSKKETIESRLAKIGEALTSVLKKYKPDELAIETLFFTTNQKTVVPVAEARGVCLYLAFLHNVSVYEYSPPQIKLAITGYGKASKEDISFMIPKILKESLPLGLLDDEIDAIAIALTHSSHRKSNGWRR